MKELYKEVCEYIETHNNIADNLYNCLSAAEELFVKPEETIKVSAILEAAYLSAKEKREVKIAELRRFWYG